MENHDLIIPSLSVDQNADLCFGGIKIKNLAQEYGTPLYLLDESRIRAKCKAYTSALKQEFGDSFTVFYASKACSFKGIYQIIQSELFFFKNNPLFLSLSKINNPNRKHAERKEKSNRFPNR